MNKIEIRNQRISDAKRFFEILSNPKFIFFSTSPKTLEAERDWLRQNTLRRKQGLWNYTILYHKKIVGGIGITIHPYRPYVGEIGYFIDEGYWNKGIATKAVRLAEVIAFTKFKLSRIEIFMQPQNKASIAVAKKNGYRKEGLLRKAIKGRDGKMKDFYLFAKVK